MIKPFERTIGPKDATVAFVSEAFTEREEAVGKPFFGAGGQELLRMLKESWDLPNAYITDVIDGMWPESRLSPSSTISIMELLCKKHSIFMTSVFPFQPQPNGSIEDLCVSKKELPEGYTLPPLKMGKYFAPEHLEHLSRLREELAEVNPTLIIAMGNTACWALLGATNISSIRGTVTTSTLVPGCKVLPTYHPVGVLRNWAWRPIVSADLMKAKREKSFKEVIRPEREVLVSPTLREAEEWIQEHIVDANPSLISVDIETRAGQITCMGFAPRRDRAIVLPFWLPEDGIVNYWEHPEEEASAWMLIKMVLEGPWPLLFQNGMYDLQYLYKMGFRPKACLHDTMLLHHSLFPELQKGLGFLGSIYSNEASWKLIRKQESLKKDE